MLILKASMVTYLYFISEEVADTHSECRTEASTYM